MLVGCWLFPLMGVAAASEKMLDLSYGTTTAPAFSSECATRSADQPAAVSLRNTANVQAWSLLGFGRNLNATKTITGAGDEAFHYTAARWGDAIKKEGLRPGSYGTTAGNLSPLQAKLELALPPTRAAPEIRIRIDLQVLRRAGYEIPSPSRVSSTVRGPDGRVYQMPGGGSEIQFPYEIPGEFLQILPIK